MTPKIPVMTALSGHGPMITATRGFQASACRRDGDCDRALGGSSQLISKKMSRPKQNSFHGTEFKPAF